MTLRNRSYFKLNIVIWDKEKEAILVEVSVHNNAGLYRAERKKITKYQNLMDDRRRNWNLRKSIIPVIIRVTRFMKKNFLKMPSRIYAVNKVQEK